MYIATYLIDIIALIYLMSLLHSSTSLIKYRKAAFYACILVTILIIVSEAATIFSSNGSADLRIINIVFNILGFSLSPMVPILIVLIFDNRILKSYKFLLIPTIVNIFATVLSIQYKIIFYIDENNYYMRGQYFYIFIAVYIINYLMLIISTLDIRKKYNYPIRRKMFMLFMFTVFGTSIQIVNPSIYVSWHCVTLTLFLYFLLVAEFDSRVDNLSGLYNRAAFDKVSNELNKAKTLSIIVLDVNDFKSINDSYGHDYGDKVINTLGKIIRDSFNRHYSCYRFGGDEFVVISHEVDREKIDAQLHAMINTLKQSREKGIVLPTLAYGYSIYTGEEKLDFNKLLKEADEQMYLFKKTEKGEAITSL